ncbi:unnamed protein product [Caenorhabditis brenneri]
MMEFDAGLCSGLFEDGEDGFDEIVEDVDDNHHENWNDETGGVCEADTSEQSYLVNPPDSRGHYCCSPRHCPPFFLFWKFS